MDENRHASGEDFPERNHLDISRMGPIRLDGFLYQSFVSILTILPLVVRGNPVLRTESPSVEM